MKTYSKLQVLAMADDLSKRWTLADNSQAADMLRAFAHTFGEPVAVPDGWQLVPVEPTEEMRLAGQSAHYEAEETCRIEIAEADIFSNKEKPGTMRRRKNRAAFVYKRMLSAAPSSYGNTESWNGEVECCDTKGFWLILSDNCPFVPGQRVSIVAATHHPTTEKGCEDIHKN